MDGATRPDKTMLTWPH